MKRTGLELYKCSVPKCEGKIGTGSYAYERSKSDKRVLAIFFTSDPALFDNFPDHACGSEHFTKMFSEILAEENANGKGNGSHKEGLAESQKI